MGHALVEGDAEEEVEGKSDAERGDELVAGIGVGEGDTDGGGSGDEGGAGGEDGQQHRASVGQADDDTGQNAERGRDHRHHDGESAEKQSGLAQTGKTLGGGHAHAHHENGQHALERLDKKLVDVGHTDRAVDHAHDQCPQQQLPAFGADCQEQVDADGIVDLGG